MLLLGGLASDLDSALSKVQSVVADGSACDLLKRFVALQGGDATSLDDFSRLPQAGQQVEIKADQAGYVQRIDSRSLGILAMELGAGRKSKDDVLDFGVGIRVHVRTGDQVTQGQTLLTLYKQPERPQPTLPTWISIGPEQPVPTAWLLETVE